MLIDNEGYGFIMALVICKFCGKSFSDTRDRCVHCGASICEEKNKEENNDKENLFLFDNFDEQRKIELEIEFLNNNIGAYKYKQKTTYDKFTHIVSIIIASITFVYALLYFVAFIEILNSGGIETSTNISGKVHNEKFLKVSIVCLLIAFLIMSIVNIVEMCVVNFNKFSIKKYIYIKEFKKWLLEKKSIKYIPVFKKESQKATFEQIEEKDIKF